MPLIIIAPVQQPSDALVPYLPLAEAALQNYSIGPVQIAFVQHNAGIVYQVTARETGRRYLLKIHKRVGEGSDPSAEQLEPGLEWLSALATKMVVQEPVRTNHGQFVGQVDFPSREQPVSFTLQHWVEGQPPHGDFTPEQVRAIGCMMAHIHSFSSTYPLAEAIPAMRHDEAALHFNTAQLREFVPLSLLSNDEHAILQAAEQRITDYISELGQHRSLWGPVHGDIHYDNVLIDGQEIRPIDFTGLRLAHFVFDIGVTIYHIFHQGHVLRRAFFAGYQQVYDLPDEYERFVEAYIAYAAIDNLAWNCTIPEQRKSALFKRNIHDLIHRYCVAVAEGRPFLFA